MRNDTIEAAFSYPVFKHLKPTPKPPNTCASFWVLQPPARVSVCKTAFTPVGTDKCPLHGNRFSALPPRARARESTFQLRDTPQYSATPSPSLDEEVAYQRCSGFANGRFTTASGPGSLRRNNYCPRATNIPVSLPRRQNAEMTLQRFGRPSTYRQGGRARCRLSVRSSWTRRAVRILAVLGPCTGPSFSLRGPKEGSAG